MKLSDFKIDTVRREDGAWVSVPMLPDVEFHVRGVGNADWLRVAEAETAKVPFAERRNGSVSRETQERIVGTCIVEAGLLGWRGIKDDEGAELAYSKELASKLIFDPVFERFRDAVLAACNLVVEIENKAVKDAEKN